MALETRLQRFRLAIHAKAQPRPVTEGMPFLGFTVFPHRRRLKRRKGIYFQRKYRQLLTDFAGGSVPLSKVSATVLGWVNHTRYGNTVGLRKAVQGKALRV